VVDKSFFNPNSKIMKKLEQLSQDLFRPISVENMQIVTGGTKNLTGGASEDTDPKFYFRPECGSDTSTNWDDDNGKHWTEFCYEKCLCPPPVS
jgi:hypothetical protein